MPDLAREHTIRESSHRVINPITPEQLAMLGRAIGMPPGTRILDLACGRGELLCTWARDHDATGLGLDISTVFLEGAHRRAAELGVADRVRFVHADATGYVAEEPVDLACCLGATWIGDGVPGTLELLAASLRPGGLAVVGHPYWRVLPPDDEAVTGSQMTSRDDLLELSELMEQFLALGWQPVEMVLADQGSWDRYRAAQWLNVWRWLADNPDDELAPSMRAELTSDPVRYTRYQREYLGWGAFVLAR